MVDDGFVSEITFFINVEKNKQTVINCKFEVSLCPNTLAPQQLL